MPRKATGSSALRGGKHWAIITQPGTKKRKWVECPPSIDTEAKRKKYAAWLNERVQSGEIVLDDGPGPGEPGKPRKPGGPGESFKDWSERWLDARTARGLLSVADDRGRLKNHVWPILGQKAIRGITTDHLEEVRDSLDAKILARTLSWKTALNAWGLVTAAFDDATFGKDRSLRVLSANPARDVKAPDRGQKPTRQYLYPDEFVRLVSADSTPERWARLFALAVYTGLRAGELEALTWADVDFAHGCLLVSKAVSRKTGKVGGTKTRTTRRVPLEPELAPLLEQLHRAAGQGCEGQRVVWLPPDEDRAEGLRRYLERARVVRAGLLDDGDSSRQITFHDLRGTHLTWCAVRGDAPLAIQQRAGHSTFSTTEGYIHEAERLGPGAGQPFPPLPGRLVGGAGEGAET